MKSVLDTIRPTAQEWETMQTVRYKSGYIHTKHDCIRHYDIIQAQYQYTIVTCHSVLSAKRWITKQMKKEYTK